MNSKQKHNIEQLLSMMEMACFDAVFDILKFQDASTIHYKVRFFRFYYIIKDYMLWNIRAYNWENDV